MRTANWALPTFPTWGWLGLAVISGVLIAALPLTVSSALIGAALLIILMLIEPSLALVMLMCVAPLKTLIETEATFNLPADPGQLALVMVMGIWGLRKIADREAFVQSVHQCALALYISLAIFLGATLLTLPNAYSLGQGISEWVKWAEIALLAYLVADFAEKRWQWILFGVLLAAVIQALIGIYQFRGGSGAAHLWILDYRYFRAFGTFGQPNPFGALMGLTLPLALGTTWGYLVSAWPHRQEPARWKTDVSLMGVYGVMAGIIFAGLLVSWSRGAWIGFAAAVVVMIWLTPPKFWQGTLAMVVVGSLFVGLWSAGLLPASISDRITSFTEDFSGFKDMRGVVINDDNFAVVERLAHWQAAIRMAEERPLLGVGFGNYEAAYEKFMLVNWPLALGHAHNYYLNLLAETGIVGLIAYLVMGAVIIRLTFRAIQKANTPIERGMAVGLMGIWTHLSIHSLFDKLYVNNLFLVIGVLLGLLAVLLSRSKQSIVRISN
ncbi:MAG: hypothetical protein DPW16_17710 [Chloroflexi bacterium]|nr:hypothetical protein [Chloroflexota bacterium]